MYKIKNALVLLQWNKYQTKKKTYYCCNNSTKVMQITTKTIWIENMFENISLIINNKLMHI